MLKHRNENEKKYFQSSYIYFINILKCVYKGSLKYSWSNHIDFLLQNSRKNEIFFPIYVNEKSIRSIDMS